VTTPTIRGPAARTHVVRFDARGRDLRPPAPGPTVLNDEPGTNLTDDSFVAALCMRLLDGTRRPSGRAARVPDRGDVCHAVAGLEAGSGAQIAIDPEAVDRACAMRRHIGSDGMAPERAYQDIPPEVRGAFRVASRMVVVAGPGVARLAVSSGSSGPSRPRCTTMRATWPWSAAPATRHHRGALTITGRGAASVRRPGKLLVRRTKPYKERVAERAVRRDGKCPDDAMTSKMARLAPTCARSTGALRPETLGRRGGRYLIRMGMVAIPADDVRDGAVPELGA